MQFEPYELSLNLILDFYQQIEQKFDHILPELNIGGGLGIRYSAKDKPLDKKEFAQKLAQTYIDTCQARAMAPPKLFIEPGRSIVAEAGLTLYQVGSIKHLPGIRTYLSVDGGMSDNIRPALYDAEYEVWAVEKALEPLSFQARIVGKHCETGDVLIKEAQLPQMEPGDILAVLATGAYNYSMASNYNRLAKPAMVMVREGVAHLVQKRESLDDLISHDVLPEHLKID
jgi:diaminopimelate decarboxylase